MLEIIAIALSLSMNLFLIFYCRFLLSNLTDLTESVKDMSIIFSGFKKHVEGLHETEMFYGDSSLQNLIEHSKFVLDKISENSEIIDLIDQEDVDETEEA